MMTRKDLKENRTTDNHSFLIVIISVLGVGESVKRVRGASEWDEISSGSRLFIVRLHHQLVFWLK